MLDKIKSIGALWVLIYQTFCQMPYCFNGVMFAFCALCPTVPGQRPAAAMTSGSFLPPESSSPPRLPSVQTTCSGSSGCTVVCTLVRLAGEARDNKDSESNPEGIQQTQAHLKLWEQAAPPLAHLDKPGLNKAPKGLTSEARPSHTLDS